MNAMNGRSGCNCSGSNVVNYRNSMNNSMNNRNGKCAQGNCGMSGEEMENIKHQCRNDSAQQCKGDPLYGMPLAMGYVPWQEWGKIYDPAEGLSCGTIFPELSIPFVGCIPKGWANGRGGRA